MIFTAEELFAEDFAERNINSFELISVFSLLYGYENAKISPDLQVQSSSTVDLKNPNFDRLIISIIVHDGALKELRV